MTVDFERSVSTLWWPEWRHRLATTALLRYAKGWHAPKHGIDINGTHFIGGEFIPHETAASVTKTGLTKTRRGFDAVKQFVVGRRRRIQIGDTTFPEGSLIPSDRFHEAKHSRKERSLQSVFPEQAFVDAATGKPVAGATRKALQRIHDLCVQIPLNLHHVQIATDPDSHILAFGYDSHQKLRYVYHPDFQERRVQEKWQRLSRFMEPGGGFQRLKQAVKSDLATATGPNLDTALAVAIMLRSGIRVDSGPKYAGAKVVGASSLSPSHVRCDADGTIHLDFVGKGNVRNLATFKDPAIAAALKKRRGRQQLFDTNYEKIRKYFKENAGLEFNVHDIRAAVATQTALNAIRRLPVPRSLDEFNHLREVVGKRVAKQLNHLPTVDRESLELTRSPHTSLHSYIHESVFLPWKSKLVEAGKRPGTNRSREGISDTKSHRPE